MPRWFPLEPVGAEFFDTAPHVFTYDRHFAAPPEKVWESLQSDESLAAWGSPAVASVTWTTPRPFGVGSKREVAAPRGITRVREQFFRWDEGYGYSFFVTDVNAPLFRKFAEDYVVEPDGTGSRFLWTVAIQPRHALTLPFKVLAPALKAGFGQMASAGEKYFATL